MDQSDRGLEATDLLGFWAACCLPVRPGPAPEGTRGSTGGGTAVCDGLEGLDHVPR